MKALRLYILLMLTVALGTTAQTYKQKGVVRMITKSSSAPLTPVSGVKVKVGNNVSAPSTSNGSFAIEVAKVFQVNDITPNDKYVLALPTKGKKYNCSSNSLDVVVITKDQQEADYKKQYAELKKKYRKQKTELDALKDEYKDRLDEMNQNDAEYARVKAQLDSVQALYLDYINNEDKIDNEIKRISEELSITDFQTLDSIGRRVYDLKCHGEWKSITDLLHTVMHGDAESYINEKLANKDKATEIRKAAEEQESAANRDLASAIRFIEESIEAFKMQNKNDSVSIYYRILTDALPDNWYYLNGAGLFEQSIMANYAKAMDYHQRALATNPTDTMLAHTYNNMGAIYDVQYDDAKALEYYEKSLNIWREVLGERNPYIALCYNNIGKIYFGQGYFDTPLEYFEAALNIQLECFDECIPDVVRSYNNIGAVYDFHGYYDTALEYYEKALKIVETHLKEDHYLVATIYNNIGYLYYFAVPDGGLNKALEFYEKALKISLEAFGDKSLSVASIYKNMGGVYRNLEEYEKALDSYEKALKIKLMFFDDNDPDVLRLKESIDFIKAQLIEQ